MRTVINNMVDDEGDIEYYISMPHTGGGHYDLSAAINRKCKTRAEKIADIEDTVSKVPDPCEVWD